MAVMKGDQAAPMLKEAIVLDLGDIGQQAAKIRAAAEARAAKIEDEARQRAAALIDNAHTKGYEEGCEAGVAQGMQDGLEQGRNQAFAQATDELNQLQKSWQQAIGELEQLHKTLHSEARSAVLELALRLAEKMVHRVIEVDQSVIIEQVASALAHVLGAYDVIVRVSPEDTPVLEQALPDLLAEFSQLKHIQIAQDASIARGGCVVNFGQGQIDATLETQLQRVVALMLPEPVDAAPVTEEQSQEVAAT